MGLLVTKFKCRDFTLAKLRPLASLKKIKMIGYNILKKSEHII